MKFSGNNIGFLISNTLTKFKFQQKVNALNSDKITNIKKKELFLFWYKIDGKRQNFGDVLGTYLIENLSGLKVVYVPIVFSSLIDFVRYIYGIFKGYNSFVDLGSLFRSRFSKSKTLISIGSIIGLYKKSNYYNIWGSGIIDRNVDVKDANFLAVRGKYTQNRLKELGYKVPIVIGDPALLLPLVCNPDVEKSYKLGLIPHYVQFDEISKIVNYPEILIIDLLDDIEKVVKDIKSCQYTISSSLHGIIVSHAYDVSSLWYNFPGGVLHGDNIKFYDYFSSVDIDNYDSFNITDFKNINSDKIIDNIRNTCKMDIIRIKIKNIQRELIKVAPFEVVEKYRVL
jgi:pyruvyltransferase